MSASPRLLHLRLQDLDVVDGGRSLGIPRRRLVEDPELLQGQLEQGPLLLHPADLRLLDVGHPQMIMGIRLRRPELRGLAVSGNFLVDQRADLLPAITPRL